MENRDAEAPIRVHIRMEKRTSEPELCSCGQRSGVCGEQRKLPTWRTIWIVFWEVHLCLEVSTIVGRFGIDWNEGDIPLKDVLTDELSHTPVSCDIEVNHRLDH